MPPGLEAHYGTPGLVLQKADQVGGCCGREHTPPPPPLQAQTNN